MDSHRPTFFQNQPSGRCISSARISYRGYRVSHLVKLFIMCCLPKRPLGIIVFKLCRRIYWPLTASFPQGSVFRLFFKKLWRLRLGFQPELGRELCWQLKLLPCCWAFVSPLPSSSIGFGSVSSIAPHLWCMAFCSQPCPGTVDNDLRASTQPSCQHSFVLCFWASNTTNSIYYIHVCSEMRP